MPIGSSIAEALSAQLAQPTVPELMMALGPWIRPFPYVYPRRIVLPLSTVHDLATAMRS